MATRGAGGSSHPKSGTAGDPLKKVATGSRRSSPISDHSVGLLSLIVIKRNSLYINVSTYNPQILRSDQLYVIFATDLFANFISAIPFKQYVN